MYFLLLSLLTLNLYASPITVLPRQGLYQLVQMDADVNYTDAGIIVTYSTDSESGDLTVTSTKDGQTHSITYPGEGAQTQCIKAYDPNTPTNLPPGACVSHLVEQVGNTVISIADCPGMKMKMEMTKLNEDLYQYVTRIEMPYQTYDVNQMMVRIGECQ